MTHTNHALHLNAFAGNWTIDQDGTLTIKGRDDRYRGVTFHQPYNTLDWEHKQDARDLDRAICIMAEPENAPKIALKSNASSKMRTNIAGTF